MSELTRRQFLHDSLLAAAAAATAGSVSTLAAADSTPQSTSPNERIRVAVLGVNGRGKAHLAEYAGRTDTAVAVICDPDENVGQKRCEEFPNKDGSKAKYVRDLRDVFDDKSIDVVSIAMPNHWHSLAGIWALQAGKDVFVEKPVSHNVSEGRRLVEAANKYNKQICQVGTQGRSLPGAQQTIEFMRSGGIGEVKLARGLCYNRRDSIGPKGVFEVPQGIDYNLWCGPAPLKPPTRNSKQNGPVHYEWHWFWDYGNGDLGNQGIHQMDVARWGLGVNELPQGVASYGGRFGYEDAAETPNTQIVLFDYGPKSLVFEVRGLPSVKFKHTDVGVVFEGTSGYAVVPKNYRGAGGAAFDKDGQLVKKFTGEGNNFARFVDALRTRNKDDIDATALEGHLSSALCHLGNISYRLGKEMSNPQIAERLQSVKLNDNSQDTLDRTIEHLAANNVTLDKKTMFHFGEFLKFDPKTESFPAGPAANALCTRNYRAPFVLPTADRV